MFSERHPQGGRPVPCVTGEAVPNEADTCRRYVVPRLQAAGWENDPHRINEQVTFTDGRIVVAGQRGRRRPGKRADYILRYRPDLAVAVVEAKPTYATPGDGLQQAKDYAEILGLKFAYATNGHGIIEFDYMTGLERELDAFPTPAELWARLTANESLSAETAERLLTPAYHLSGKSPRYYQEIAINRAVKAIASGDPPHPAHDGHGHRQDGRRLPDLLEALVSPLEPDGRLSPAAHPLPRRPQHPDRRPDGQDLRPLRRCPLEDRKRPGRQSREMYFATYQAIARDANRPGLYREFAPDFFDLIIVDECHRGSARDESNWREILDYFQPAIQLGMTATPRRQDNADTYIYFGDPIYTYSLRQGIDDGFLAPYRVHRIVTTWDAAGWRPSQGELDRFGREIPDEEYQTNDFERRSSPFVPAPRPSPGT